MDGLSKILLIRPYPLDDESWCGYLLRVANTNGYSGLRSIARICKLSPSQLININPVVIINRLQLSVCHESQGTNTGFINKLNSSDDSSDFEVKSSRYTRLCPLCIKEDHIPYLRAEWDRPTVLHCQKHFCLLLDTCPHCSSRLDIFRSSIDFCKCGLDLKIQTVKAVPTWLYKFYELLEIYPYQIKLFNSGSSTAVNDAASRLINRLSGVAKFIHIDKLQVMKKSRNRTLILISDLFYLEYIFDDWPNKFLDTLKAYKNQYHGQWSAIHPNIMRANNFPAIDFIVRNFHLDNFRRYPINVGRNISWCDQSDSVVSAFHLCKMSGASRNDLTSMIDNNLLDGIIVNDYTYKVLRYAIPNKHVQILADYYQSTFNESECSIILGSTKRAFRILALSGILVHQTAVPTVKRHRYSIEVLWEFLSNFVVGNRFNSKKHSELISSSAAFVIVNKRGKSALIRFLDAVFLGKIERVRLIKNPMFVDEIFFNLSSVTDFEMRGRGRPRVRPTLAELSGF